MKIAILGWGSLIWDPRSLKFDVKTGWLTDGPMLPIEFARISGDGRLTLVMKEGAAEVQTLYAISSYSKLDEAIIDLAIREGSGKDKIGVYVKEKESFEPTNFAQKANIIAWINNTDIDAVIWTNLPAKLNYIDNQKRLIYVAEDKLVDYIKNLEPIKSAKAEEYIRKAPNSVRTPLRKKIEEELKWYPMEF